MSVGVIVGRFQVDEPHSGHVQLIEQVMKRHGKVMLLLGCAPARLTKQDPLDYETRAKMMHHWFPNAVIAPIFDMPSDEAWSHQLDDIVRQTFPTDTDIVLYGGRKAFFPHYKGRIPVKEIETVKVPSATDLRDELGQRAGFSSQFRHGVIYACYNKFPMSYQVVDVAIVQKDRSVLLCRKKHDSLHVGGFIGGFVSPGDNSLEMAARREVYEETGLEVGSMIYLGSAKIDDWRYRNREDKMMSAFFMADYTFGAPKAADDIVACEWVSLEYVPARIVPQHEPLARMLMTHLART